MNGYTCKDPKTVTADDFVYTGLDQPGEIISSSGSRITTVFDYDLKGLNYQGISMVRIDYTGGGLNPPHSHPRSSELFIVIEGKLYAGFITSNPRDRNDRPKLFAKVLYPGDVIVFPKGLIHFQYNLLNESAIAMASFNSQNPGVVSIARASFGADPPVLPEILAKTYEIDRDLVEYLQSLPWTGNN